VVEQAAALARATVDALGEWVSTPWD
jgi:hypothetical protein